MASSKDILVVTTSSIDGIKIKQYLRPISAHIVAGTNLFSDFFASLTDVFGGRSQTYQKQLTSLYEEAIDRIRLTAYEIGANCVIGLRIDMDEISGKGKSMFMLTATGTAAIFEKDSLSKEAVNPPNDKFENVSVERIDILRKKKSIIKQVEAKTLELNNSEIWEFITLNQVDEIFPYILEKYAAILPEEKLLPTATDAFHNKVLNFVDALSETKKTNLLYYHIEKEDNEQLALKLCKIVNELDLLDITRCLDMLKSKRFQAQKRALWILTYDKPFYSRQDLADLEVIRELVDTLFTERGARATKKQVLSSKEREVWNCECGKENNDIGSYCSSCKNDIYGFKSTETKPAVISNYVQQKIELIHELIK